MSWRDLEALWRVVCNMAWALVVLALGVVLIGISQILHALRPH